MGYTWRHRHDGSSEALETDEFAEVLYEDQGLLVVHVARSLAADGELEDALVDAIARRDRRVEAEREISTVAHAFGLVVHEDGDGDHRALTLAPSRSSPPRA
jgi:hypothetical protein